MPKKEQGWITFQSSEQERQILEQVCQRTQRTKTDVLRELIRQMSLPSATEVREEETIVPSLVANTLQAVRISARNMLRTTVTRITKGKVNVEVTLTIAPGVELVSVVTRTSAEALGLAVGKEVFAVIKSNSVMIASS